MTSSPRCLLRWGLRYIVWRARQNLRRPRTRLCRSKINLCFASNRGFRQRRRGGGREVGRRIKQNLADARLFRLVKSAGIVVEIFFGVGVRDVDFQLPRQRDLGFSIPQKASGANRPRVMSVSFNWRLNSDSPMVLIMFVKFTSFSRRPSSFSASVAFCNTSWISIN